jgi:hypothetical protein
MLVEAMLVEMPTRMLVEALLVEVPSGRARRAQPCPTC